MDSSIACSFEVILVGRNSTFIFATFHISFRREWHRSTNTDIVRSFEAVTMVHKWQVLDILEIVNLLNLQGVAVLLCHPH